MRRLAGRLRRAEGGYSLIELVMVMAILSTVLGGLTALFLSASRSELSLNNRFQAQLNAALALSKLRTDVHCASTITPTGAASSITLTQPTQCSGGGGQVSWCTVASGSTYDLYRKTGATCDATGIQEAESLTVSNVFTFTAQVAATSLAKLHVDLPVNVSSKTLDQYELIDDLVLRNSSRT